MQQPVLLAADVEHFAEHGWLLTRSHDDVDARRGLGRRGRGLARRRGRVAAPPRAHRRRPAAVPHRELRAVPRGLRDAAHHRDRCWRRRRPCWASRRCSTRRRSTTSSRRRRLHAAPGRARVPVRRDPRVVHGRRRRRAGGQRLPRGGVGPAPRAAARWTTPGCIHPDVVADAGLGSRWRCGPARRCGSTPARRTAAAPTSGRRRGGRCTPPTTRWPRATCAPPTTSRSAPSCGDRRTPVSLIGDFQGRPVR